MVAFLKALAIALYERVFKAYKSTLLGMLLVGADVVVSQLSAAPLPNWAHAIVGVAAAILALYKGKASVPELKAVE